VRAITVHIEEEQIEMIARVADERRERKATIIREFLNRGYRDWRREQARKLIAQEEEAVPA
jgi:uncharacterized ferredoxin-like protein